MLELDRQACSCRDRRIAADHHSAARDVADEAKLAAAIDDERADPQQADIALALPAFRAFWRRRGERIESRLDKFLGQEGLRSKYATCVALFRPDFRRTGPTRRRLIADKPYQTVSITFGHLPRIFRRRNLVHWRSRLMMWRTLMMGWALAGSTALSAQTATTTLDAVSGVPEIDKTTQTQDVKFHNERDDRMTVVVRLAGAGPYHFIVDTAADRTAVSREVADALKLPLAGGAQLHSVAGVTQVATARIRDLEFTHPPEQSIEAAVLDGRYIGADGIVGADVLRSQRVQFDFEKQTMSIVPSSAPDPGSA